MHHIANPFIHHALQHGQMLLAESNRSAALSQNLVPTCDDIIISLTSGNLQGAVVSAQNARNMAIQAAQSTQHINTVLNERMDMAHFVLSKIQQNVGELTGALESIKMSRTAYAGLEPWWAAQFQPAPASYMA